MLRLPIIICLTLSVFTGWGQMFEVSENFKQSSLGLQTYHYEDLSNSQTITEVENSNWQLSKKDFFNFGYNTQTHWFKNTITNTSSKNKELVLEFTASFLDSINCFVFQKNKQVQKYPIKGMRTGNPNPNKFYIYPFIIQPSDTLTFYTQTRTEIGSVRAKIRLFNKTEYWKTDMHYNIFWAFFTGCVLFVILFDLFFYFSIRDKVYYLHAFMVLANTLGLLGSMGYFNEFLFNFKFDNRALFNPFLLYFSIQFIRAFIPSDYKVNWVDKILNYISYTAFLIPVVFFAKAERGLLFDCLIAIKNFAFVFAILGFFQTLIYSVRKGYKPSWVVLIAYLPLLVLYFFTLVRNYGLITGNYYFLGGSIATLFEIIVLTLALSLKFKAYKDEKENLLVTVNKQQDDFIKKSIQIQEDERKRISKDLHDGVGQQLSGLKMAFQNIISKNEIKKEEATKLGSIIDETCEDVRTISHQMMPRVLNELGLVPAIEDMLDKSFSLSNITYNFETYNVQSRYKESIEISLCRITQELVNNIIKHSGANKVNVQLLNIKNHLILMVEDNGKGAVSNNKLGHGLQNIKNRLNTVHGEFNFEPSPNSGTVATIRIPIDE